MCGDCFWVPESESVKICGCENDDFRINGNHLEIFDSQYSEWEAYEINFCPLCGKKLDAITKDAK